jgi:serine/threonine protein kinase
VETKEHLVSQNREQMVPDVNEPQAGEVIADKYRLRRLIGRGGFGLVYDALWLQVQRQVALKLLLPRWSHQDPEIAIRFRREAILASQLRHHNTITLYDYGGTPDGILYMAMEYVEGQTLSVILRDEAPLAPDRVRHLLTQILGSLQEAHTLGIIHRDLKPGNIMITRRHDAPEAVKVLDFGIAKAISPELLGGEDGISHTLTQAGQFCGTPRYMAPEQFRGGGVTPSCDLYALGLIAYELLTAEPALKGETMVDLIVQQVAGPNLRLPPKLAVPADLREIIHKALQKDPEQRWRDAASFRMALQQGLAPPSAADLLGGLQDADSTLELSASGARRLRALHPRLDSPSPPPAPVDNRKTLLDMAPRHVAAAALNAPLDEDMAPTELRDPFQAVSQDTLDHDPLDDDGERTRPNDLDDLDGLSVMVGGAASSPALAARLRRPESPSDDLPTTELVRDHFPADDPMDNEATLDISKSVLFQQNISKDAYLPPTDPPFVPSPLPSPDQTVDMSAALLPGDARAARFSPRMQANRVTTAAPSRLLSTRDGVPSGARHGGGAASAPASGWTPLSVGLSALLLLLLLGALAFGAHLLWGALWGSPPAAPGEAGPVAAPARRHERLTDLARPTITIRVESEPPAADVIIQGEVVGQTPLELVRSQDHQEKIRLRKADYLELATELTFSHNQRLPVLLNPLP